MNERYLRHYSVPHFGKEGQERLAGKSVAIVGAGGLGCPVLTQLAGAGVGELIIIENDTVQLSNLSRQLLYTMDDIGRLKAEVAKGRLETINPDVSITIHTVKLTTENALDLLAPADLVIDCSDNFSTRYLLNDACVILNKPWVFGAIESWVGQYAVFNYPIGQGPTYRCIFPESPTDAPDCNEAGVLPPLPAVIGSYLANAALQVLAEIKKHFSGRLFQLDLLNHTTQTLKFKRNEEAVKSIASLNQPEYDTAFCTTPERREIAWEEYCANPDAYRLIDIREEFEYEVNPSPGKNIPYHILLESAAQLISGKPILLACETGKRSLILSQKLADEYPEAKFYSLQWGIVAALLLPQS
jgi:adenylyltransferase/sulfurtransferase